MSRALWRCYDGDDGPGFIRWDDDPQERARRLRGLVEEYCERQGVDADDEEEIARVLARCRVPREPRWLRILPVAPGQYAWAEDYWTWVVGYAKGPGPGAFRAVEVWWAR